MDHFQQGEPHHIAIDRENRSGGYYTKFLHSVIFLVFHYSYYFVLHEYMTGLTAAHLVKPIKYENDSKNLSIFLILWLLQAFSLTQSSFEYNLVKRIYP